MALNTSIVKHLLAVTDYAGSTRIVCALPGIVKINAAISRTRLGTLGPETGSSDKAELWCGLLNNEELFTHAELICGADMVPVNNALFNLRWSCGGPGPYKQTVAKLKRETTPSRPHYLGGGGCCGDVILASWRTATGATLPGTERDFGLVCVNLRQRGWLGTLCLAETYTGPLLSWVRLMQPALQYTSLE